jgi:hypothetical protein
VVGSKAIKALADEGNSVEKNSSSFLLIVERAKRRLNFFSKGLLEEQDQDKTRADLREDERAKGRIVI